MPFHDSDAPVSVTRIVHGSYLLDLQGVHVLVDPWYFPRGLVNQSEPLGLTFRTLPALELLLITHGHRDHLDQKALARLPDHDLPAVVSRGLRASLQRVGYRNITELDWWETVEVAGVTIHAVPADHGKHENGYVLERGGVRVYVAGDTRYFDGLADIAQAFAPIDVALLPIGGMRIFGILTEMRPRDAARAVDILNPRRVIPTHYGLTGPPPLFWGSRHPVSAFRSALAENGRDDRGLVVLRPGESWHYLAR